MAFPADSGENGAEAVQVNTRQFLCLGSPSETDLCLVAFTLSLDPTVTATGNVHAALIPRIDLGVRILSGLAEATIYLDLEVNNLPRLEMVTS